MLRDIVGIDRVVFGTDYPYFRTLPIECQANLGPVYPPI